MTGTVSPVISQAGGPVADLLGNADVPFAAAIGSAVSFVVVFAAIYTVGKAVIGPVVAA
jgi:hypothetical protein